MQTGEFSRAANFDEARYPVPVVHVSRLKHRVIHIEIIKL
jgi:hypothetical protein